MASNEHREAFGPCAERTILLMGRSGTGKSTIAEVLETALTQSKPMSLHSETREIKKKNIFITDKSDGKSYALNVIGAPGLFETRHNADARSNNRALVDGIITSVGSDVRQPNLIGIVINLVQGIHEQDIETMIYIKKHFRGMEKNVALIITHCEDQDQEERKRLSDEFLKHPSVRKHQLTQFFQQGIHYMGCLRLEYLKATNEQAIYSEYINVAEMRAAFIQRCIQCEETVSLSPSACPIM